MAVNHALYRTPPCLALLLVLCGCQSAQIPANAQFRDCADCPQMVVIPAGSAELGSSGAEREREGVTAAMAAMEQAPHQANFTRPWAVSRFEITRAEYAAFRRAQPGDGQMGCEVYDAASQRWSRRDELSWRNPGFAQNDRHPAICLSWNDASEYVAWLTMKTGKSYRLLTESEWEYAARAGTRSARFWGDDRERACQFANVSDLTRADAQRLNGKDPDLIFQCRDGAVQTAEVGKRPPNAFGLHDVQGNVWEWLQDCSSADCTKHVDRGGSWVNSPKYLRSAARHADVTQMRNDVLGLRVARELD
jgi:formylglycine-generating enzyme